MRVRWIVYNNTVVSQQLHKSNADSWLPPLADNQINELPAIPPSKSIKTRPEQFDRSQRATAPIVVNTTLKCTGKQAIKIGAHNTW